jgi:hypothetical protein
LRHITFRYLTTRVGDVVCLRKRTRPSLIGSPERSVGGDFHALDELMALDLAQEFKRDIAETRQAFPD